MTYVKVNVLKPGDNKGVGGDKKDKVIVFDWDDVKNNPPRDSKGIVITGNLVFNPGAYMSKIYATQSTIKAGADSTGDPDAKGIEQSVEFSHPGDSVEIREFRANWMNKNIGIVIEKCSSAKKNLYGTPCSPLQMVFKAEDDKDKNSTSFTFKSTQKGPDVADYQGTLAFDAPIATIQANTVLLPVAGGEGQYQLTSGTITNVVCTGLEDCEEDKAYTFLGSGGAHPMIIEPTSPGFVMRNGGGLWNAYAGSWITFKCIMSDGDWYYIEQARG